MAGASAPSQSVKTAEAACKAMATHGVVPTPHNYTVWYTYAARNNAGAGHRRSTP